MFTQTLLEEVEQSFRISNVRQLYQKLNVARGGYNK